MTANAAPIIQESPATYQARPNRAASRYKKKVMAESGTTRQEMKNAPKRKAGRPNSYTEKAAAEICRRVALGETLTQICADSHLPEMYTIFEWVESRKEFAEQYRTARRHSATSMVEKNQIEIDAADDPAMAALLKVKSESRRWIAARHAPELYGDVKRLEVSGEVRHAHALELTQEQRMRIAQEWLTGLESAKTPALIEGTAETTGPDKPKRIKKV